MNRAPLPPSHPHTFALRRSRTFRHLSASFVNGRLPGTDRDDRPTSVAPRADVDERPSTARDFRLTSAVGTKKARRRKSNPVPQGMAATMITGAEVAATTCVYRCTERVWSTGVSDLQRPSTDRHGTMSELMTTGIPDQDLPLLEAAARSGLLSAVVVALCECYTARVAAALSAVLMRRLDADSAEDMANIFAARLGLPPSRTDDKWGIH
jgi:hypothetical protein